MKQLLLKIANIPFVWNTAQNIVGANPWKNRVYPSVFETKGKLLDFGCSIGNNTGVFLDFDEYHGVDLDPLAIAGAKERWKEYPQVQFHALDILENGYKQAYFDHVLFACAGHHIPDALMRPILDALFLNLRPGGTLHFFDVLRQPEKDRYITRLILKNDQGKFMRTRGEYDTLFAPYQHLISEDRMFPSPDRLIKLQDMRYLRLVKHLG